MTEDQKRFFTQFVEKTPQVIEQLQDDGNESMSQEWSLLCGWVTGIIMKFDEELEAYKAREDKAVEAFASVTAQMIGQGGGSEQKRSSDELQF